MLEVFTKRNELWEENVKKINQELANQRHAIIQDTKGIEEREKRIDAEKESIEKQRKYIESQQATLLSSYEVEKDLWNKIHQ